VRVPCRVCLWSSKIETILQKLAITRSYDKVFVASKYLGNDTLLTNEVIGKILKTLNFDKSFVHAAIAQLQETVEMQGGTVTKLQEAVEMQGETVAQLQAAVEMQGEQVDELNEKVEEQGEKLLAVETLKEQVADLAKARDKTTAELRAELDTVIFAQSELEIKFTDQVVEVDEKLVEAEINFKRYVARFVFGLVVPILLIVFGTQNIFQKDVKTRQDNLEADVVALREDIKSENAKRKSEHAEFKAEIYLLIGELKMRTIRATNYLARSMSYLLGWTAGLQTEVDKQAESNKKMGDRITGVAESTRKKMLVMHAEFDASKAIAKA
jgi:cell division protein FtsB